MQNRRHFITQAVATAALAGTSRAETKESPQHDWPIVLFEKPVQALSYDEIGEQLASMGAQGIEATIRRNGHITPDEAATRIPGMLKSLAKSGLSTVIAATDVSEADQKTADFLKTLKDHGITCYRMAHYRYARKENPLDQVEGYRRKLLGLAELNEKLGMQGLYQTHSGHVFVGSLVWDIVGMLKGIDPSILGIAYDLRHTRNETGNSWRQAAAIAKDHIGSLFIKDAKWEGERNNKIAKVPLDTGFVTREIFDHTRRGLKPMPLSLHMEWGKHPVYPKESAREAWDMIRKDMQVLKEWRG